MLDVHTPVLIKYWYCLVVMMVFYLLPTLDSTTSPVTFLSTEGSTCSDTCGAERELVNNDNIQERILNYSNEGQKKKIRCLDTSKITNMDFLFSGESYYGFTSKDFNVDLSCWDVSSVTSMVRMFREATVFNNDLSTWDVSSVTDMNGMFLVASAFNTDLSSWDVSSVTSMEFMFNQASVFNNDLSSWDVSSVTSMEYMFYNAQMFGMKLCNWNLENLFYMSMLFDGSNCDFKRCFMCNYAPTSSPSFTLLSSSPSSSSVSTLSPTTVSSCEKDNGKKFDYRGDKYSCKQLNKSKKKYGKKMCMRVNRAKNFCPVICKNKI